LHRSANCARISTSARNPHCPHGRILTRRTADPRDLILR
jgi:hypothetical protein